MIDQPQNPETAPRDRYTHGHHESVLRSYTWRTVANSAAYLVPHLDPGLSLLDVGCGPGTITVDLARRLAPGRVTGTRGLHPQPHWQSTIRAMGASSGQV